MNPKDDELQNQAYTLSTPPQIVQGCDGVTQSALPEQYQILEEIGRGGMGIVYKAKHQYMNRIVAIKMLHVNTMSADSLQRFQREAIAACSFTHPNAVAVYEFGVTSASSPYMVMEYAEGESLADALARQGRLDETRVIAIAKQICGALDAAHQSGVVHRDIKPSNVLLCTNRDGNLTAKIVDFGIAKIVGPDTGNSELTKTGAIIGTPLYMSPEQCSGVEVDNRSDLYSLGAVLYACLTGTPPHVGNNALHTIFRRQSESPESFRSHGLEVTDWLAAVIFRLLERAPHNRFQTAKELLSALDNSTQGGSGENEPLINPSAHRTSAFGWVTEAKLRIKILAGSGAILFFIAAVVMGLNFNHNLDRTELRAAPATKEKPGTAASDLLPVRDMLSTARAEAQLAVPIKDTRPAEAKIHFLKSLEAYEQSPARQSTEEWGIQFQLAKVLFFSHDLDGAERWAQKTVDSINGVPSRPDLAIFMRAVSYHVLGDIDVERGKDATAHYDRAWEDYRNCPLRDPNTIRAVRKLAGDLQNYYRTTNNPTKTSEIEAFLAAYPKG